MSKDTGSPTEGRGNEPGSPDTDSSGAFTGSARDPLPGAFVPIRPVTNVTGQRPEDAELFQILHDLLGHARAGRLRGLAIVASVIVDEADREPEDSPYVWSTRWTTGSDQPAGVYEMYGAICSLAPEFYEMNWTEDCYDGKRA